MGHFQNFPPSPAENVPLNTSPRPQPQHRPLRPVSMHLTPRQPAQYFVLSRLAYFAPPDALRVSPCRSMRLDLPPF